VFGELTLFLQQFLLLRRHHSPFLLDPLDLDIDLDTGLLDAALGRVRCAEYEWKGEND
jgi:hypothetical protein